MHKGNPARCQLAIRKRDEDQALLGNIPFNAEEGLKGDAAAIPRQGRHHPQGIAFKQPVLPHRPRPQRPVEDEANTEFAGGPGNRIFQALRQGQGF